MFKSKTIFRAFSLAGIFFALCLFVSPAFSQMTAATARLSVMGKESKGMKPFITVNGANSLNESSLMSPASISVPADTTAVVNLGKAGQIELSPGTMISLTFTDNAVTIDLSGGRLRVTSPASADFNVKTADGIIINDRRGDAVFVAEVVGGATGVNTETGIAKVNGVPLAAGKVWTSDPKLKDKFIASTAKGKAIKSNSGRGFWRYAVAAAAGVGVGVIIGVAARH